MYSENCVSEKNYLPKIGTQLVITLQIPIRARIKAEVHTFKNEAWAIFAKSTTCQKLIPVE